jgi:D-serine deaminase-like pyridoxal phosphate-dependent protein
MTAATVGQAQVMARYGVRRILIANEVLDRRAIRWLGETDADLYCLVDSVAGVEALDGAGREIKVPRRGRDRGPPRRARGERRRAARARRGGALAVTSRRSASSASRAW